MIKKAQPGLRLFAIHGERPTRRDAAPPEARKLLPGPLLLRQEPAHAPHSGGAPL